MTEMEDKLAKYFAGELSNAENEEILSWRNQSNENAQAFFEYKQIWSATTKVYPTVSSQDLIDREAKSVSFASTNWMRYAAGVLVAVALGLIVFFIFGREEVDPTGMTKVVKLDDGSRVTLYKNSRLVSMDFSKEKRTVQIEGKVYFDIKRDEERPFIIYTEQAMIEVLGTSFVVNAEIENTTEVIVENGLVSFSQNPNNYKQKVTRINLSKGEKGTISPRAKGIIKQNNRDINYLAWKNKLITFDHDKLSEAAEVIEEVYGYQVVFSQTNLSRCSLTAKYNKKSPEEIAALIANTFDFTYQITEDKKIVFSGMGCN